jgi:hypothetical protein
MPVTANRTSDVFFPAATPGMILFKLVIDFHVIGVRTDYDLRRVSRDLRRSYEDNINIVASSPSKVTISYPSLELQAAPLRNLSNNPGIIAPAPYILRASKATRPPLTITA